MGPPVQDPHCGTPIAEPPCHRCPRGVAGCPPQLSVRGADTAVEARCKAPGALGWSLGMNRGQR